MLDEEKGQCPLCKEEKKIFKINGKRGCIECLAKEENLTVAQFLIGCILVEAMIKAIETGVIKLKHW